MSTVTPEMLKALQKTLRWRALAEEKGKLHAVDPNLILAMMVKESTGNPWAERPEPGYRWLWYPRELGEKLGTGEQLETIFQKCSWGLLQLMGANYRALGFLGTAQDIGANPSMGLDYAVRYLKGLEHRWPEETDWISAYNQGGPYKTKGGLYLNQKGYVDPVCAYLRELRKLA